MRISAVIDDELMNKVMKLSDASTKKGALEEALRLLVPMKSQERLRQLRGKLPWEGDLEEMRRDG